MTLYTAILDKNKFVFFLAIKEKRKEKKKHTYLKHTSIIPTPQSNLNIILTFYNFTDMQKEKKKRE